MKIEFLHNGEKLLIYITGIEGTEAALAVQHEFALAENNTFEIGELAGEALTEMFRNIQDKVTLTAKVRDHD